MQGVSHVGEETEGVRYRSIHFPFHVVYLLQGGIPGGEFPPLVACALCRFTTVKQVRYTQSRGSMYAGTRQQALIC